LKGAIPPEITPEMLEEYLRMRDETLYHMELLKVLRQIASSLNAIHHDGLSVATHDAGKL